MRKGQKLTKWDVHQFGSRWLADGNEAEEAGDMEKAEKCFKKAQYWLDRLNLMEGYWDDGSKESKRRRK